MINGYAVDTTNRHLGHSRVYVSQLPGSAACCLAYFFFFFLNDPPPPESPPLPLPAPPPPPGAGGGRPPPRGPPVPAAQRTAFVAGSPVGRPPLLAHRRHDRFRRADGLAAAGAASGRRGGAAPLHAAPLLRARAGLHRAIRGAGAHLCRALRPPGPQGVALRGGALLRGEAVRRAGCAAPHPAPAAAAFVEGDLGPRLAGGRDGARSDPAAGARRSFGIRPRR